MLREVNLGPAITIRTKCQNFRRSPGLHGTASHAWAVFSGVAVGRWYFEIVPHTGMPSETSLSHPPKSLGLELSDCMIIVSCMVLSTSATSKSEQLDPLSLFREGNGTSIFEFAVSSPALLRSLIFELETIAMLECCDVDFLEYAECVRVSPFHGGRVTSCNGTGCTVGCETPSWNWIGPLRDLRTFAIHN